MIETAAHSFRALAHDIRLAAFRLLIQTGTEGLAAGRIAEQLSVPASTLSSHLARLEQAGLIYSWRDQQRILYAVDLEGLQSMLRFLLEDCCGGNPDLCGIGIKKGRSGQRTLSIKTG